MGYGPLLLALALPGFSRWEGLCLMLVYLMEHGSQGANRERSVRKIVLELGAVTEALMNCRMKARWQIMLQTIHLSFLYY